jgi:hypothetical protein
VYDAIRESGEGEVRVGDEVCRRGAMVRVNGDVKRWQWDAASCGGKALIGPQDVARASRGGPQMLFVGSGPAGELSLSSEAQAYLAWRGIGCEVLPTGKAIKAYNNYPGHKAALVHLG